MEGGTILDYKIIRIILTYMKLFGKLVIFFGGLGWDSESVLMFCYHDHVSMSAFSKLYKENQYSILNT